MKKRLIFYGENSTLDFGKHKGKRLGDVINCDTSYVIWALSNINLFVLKDDALENLCKSAYVLCSWNNIDPKKLELINAQNMSSLILKSSTDDYDDRDDDKPTYSKYSGSYAQDYEGYSDQIIDDAFEGDPDAYWNID